MDAATNSSSKGLSQKEGRARSRSARRSRSVSRKRSPHQKRHGIEEGSSQSKGSCKVQRKTPFPEQSLQKKAGQSVGSASVAGSTQPVVDDGGQSLQGQGAAAAVAAGGKPGVTRSSPPAALVLDGFQTQRLNTTYTVNTQIMIDRKPTYWNDAASLFMYFQAAQRRWAISPREDDGNDLLVDALRGGTRGLAFEESPGKWSEFHGHSWVTAVLKIAVLGTTPTCPPPKLPPTTRKPPVRTAPVIDAPSKLRNAVHTEGQASVMIRRDSRLPGSGQHTCLWSAPDVPITAASTKTPFLDEARRLLEGSAHIEEVLLLRKTSSIVQVAIRFRDMKTAGVAADTANQLIQGCRPESIESLSVANFCNFRNQCADSWSKEEAKQKELSAAETSEAKPVAGQTPDKSLQTSAQDDSTSADQKSLVVDLESDRDHSKSSREPGAKSPRIEAHGAEASTNGNPHN